MKKYITLIALLVCSQALAADRATIVDRNGNELGTSGNPIKVSLAGGGGAAASITADTNPTVDASGEIAEDTTVAGQLILGAGADVHTPIRQLTIGLENPADTQNILLGKLPYGIIIQSITCGCDPADSSESVVIDVQERDASGDSPASADATITCDNDGAADDGSLSNATFDKNDWWSLDIGTVTGTVSNAFVTIKYKVVRE